ncbi:hypothetical protein [Candidatus Amarobacter glycogenicus]|uniref:hypothetical protein n=1 Tax=Candidatus Amarobacter glycogenicus TaxID=3140699 RepID=UPI002A14DEB1|nr:hypothetical protein [Dehalococcoidia bacterium]
MGGPVQLVVGMSGGARKSTVAALGQPGNIHFCFPEFEERSDWESLHVERGFERTDSTVTVYAGGAPNGIIDQLSRGAESLATSYGLALATSGHPKQYGHGEIVVVIPQVRRSTFAGMNGPEIGPTPRALDVPARPTELIRD